MSFPRLYWRFVWSLGAACMREWAGALASQPRAQLSATRTIGVHDGH
jgi:hypothetical protein